LFLVEQDQDSVYNLSFFLEFKTRYLLASFFLDIA
jgi:hypothetical protein